MWSLYENDKKLDPLIFSNGKDQENVVAEVLDAINKGHKIIFIRGMCGTGKSAIALNLARNFSKTSIVVPIKSLQEQYAKDYSFDKYVLRGENRLKIATIFGRKNFKCKYLEETNVLSDLSGYKKEKNSNLHDIFAGVSKTIKKDDDPSCDNNLIPCKIEIKEKNIDKIKYYIKQNPKAKLSNFDTIADVKRMSIAPVCPYWTPILPSEIELNSFKDAQKMTYMGLNNKSFTVYGRTRGCSYYDQYYSYENSDVIIFNSLKYKIENLLDRKPATEIDIIDECDDFLDSLANKETLSLNRLIYSLSTIFTNNLHFKEVIQTLIGIANNIKNEYNTPVSEIYELSGTVVGELLDYFLENLDVLDLAETEESSYVSHLERIVLTFKDFFNETYFSIEKSDTDFLLSFVTTNLEKRLKELAEKNNVLVMMSGTIHSESVLRDIFGITDFKVIDAETKSPGQLTKCKHGYELDCKYSNFQNGTISRVDYLNALSKSVECAKRPTLVHVNSFSDLPNEHEKKQFSLDNLPTSEELIKKQNLDPFGKSIIDFKEKKTNLLFTTKCSRGVDFPGDICNSIVITRFPYPNISSIFWKILKKTRPGYFMSFYMDKARRELLQKVYRGLRSKDDTLYLLSPDIRVLNFDFE